MDDQDKTGLINNEFLKVNLDQLAKREASFIIIRGNGQGKRYELNKDLFVIGRDAAADIVLNDHVVSRRHAEISKVNDEVWLRDNGSTNGTIVNGERLSGPVVLHKEDMIQVGQTILKYLPKGELEIVYMGMLESAAHTDTLTQLYNKGYIMEALEAEFKRAKALQHELCIFIVDADFFKHVNDTYGHIAGDEVLKHIAHTISKYASDPCQLVGRFGGEEFLMLLPNVTADEAVKTAERLRSDLQAHACNYEGRPLPITVSIGVASSLDAPSPIDLFKLADQAVYRAKNGGRNRVCLPA